MEFIHIRMFTCTNSTSKKITIFGVSLFIINVIVLLNYIKLKFYNICLKLQKNTKFIHIPTHISIFVVHYVMWYHHKAQAFLYLLYIYLSIYLSIHIIKRGFCLSYVDIVIAWQLSSNPTCQFLIFLNCLKNPTWYVTDEREKNLNFKKKKKKNVTDIPFFFGFFLPCVIPSNSCSLFRVSYLQIKKHYFPFRSITFSFSWLLL